MNLTNEMKIVRQGVEKRACRRNEGTCRLDVASSAVHTLVRFSFNFQNPYDRLEIREGTREGVSSIRGFLNRASLNRNCSLVVSFSPMKTRLIFFFFLLPTHLRFLNITIILISIAFDVVIYLFHYPFTLRSRQRFILPSN